MLETTIVCLLMLLISIGAGTVWGPLVGAVTAVLMMAALLAWALVTINQGEPDDE